MSEKLVTLITGSRKGIGRYLAEYYVAKGHHVIGCSRGPADWEKENYEHHQLDVTDEKAVLSLFQSIRKNHKRLDHLINNAGVASMNHSLLTPLSAAEKMLSTNVLGTFLFCREAAKIMKRKKFGRIVNFSTVAVPLKVEGEAVYAASKAAVTSLTEILAKEFSEFSISVNAIGPTPIETDLIKAVPEEKIQSLVARQTISRLGTFQDVSNVIDFYLRPESNFITGQTIFLGGV